MPLEINRRVLEQLVKDKEYMYTIIANWAAETYEHFSWYGISFHDGKKTLKVHPRGSTQISIKYHTWSTDYLSENDIEKRIVKYKKL